jgi:hypothetical protein
MRALVIITALAEISGIGSLCIAVPCFIVWAMVKFNEKAIDQISYGEWRPIPDGLRASAGQTAGRDSQRTLTLDTDVIARHDGGL